MDADGLSCDSMASQTYFQNVKARKENMKSRRSMQAAVEAFSRFWAERPATWPTVPSDQKSFYTSKSTSSVTTAEVVTVPERALTLPEDTTMIDKEVPALPEGFVSEPGHASKRRRGANQNVCAASSSDTMAVTRGPVDTFMNTIHDGLTSLESVARTLRAQMPKDGVFSRKMPAEVEIPTGFCSGMELPVTGFDGQTYAVSIPPGLQAGMTFRTELPVRMSTISMEFFVPKGFTTGTTIQVKGPDGQMHRTLVPDGLAADRLLSIQIPCEVGFKPALRGSDSARDERTGWDSNL